MHLLLAASHFLRLAPQPTSPGLRLPPPTMQYAPARDRAGAPVGNGFSGRVVPRNRPVAADSSILLQGGCLRTWSYRSPSVEQVQVVLSTDGRPLDADIELWHGPDNIPCKMRVYVDNGQMRPFNVVIETPRSPATVAVRNIGRLEFPLSANCFADYVDNPSAECISSSTIIQGGSLRTYPFDAWVDSVQVLLRTDGRPLNARIELIQGPNNNKQVIELYTEDGRERPFFCILATPDAGNVVRVVNTAPFEFPLIASAAPNSIANWGPPRGGRVSRAVDQAERADRLRSSGTGMEEQWDEGRREGWAEGVGDVFDRFGEFLGGGRSGGGSDRAVINGRGSLAELVDVLRNEFRFDPGMSWDSMVAESESRIFGRGMREGSLKERAMRCVEMLR